MKTLSRLSILFLAAIILSGCSNQAPGTGLKVGMTVGKPQAVFSKFGYDFNSEYIKALESEGAEVIKISVYDSPDEVKKKLQTLKGILVPGGVDIEPSRYGEKPDPLLERIDPELDALEYKILTWAKEKKLPVLGICRGHQMLNVFHGGSLYQDIPKQYASPQKVLHRKRSSFLFITRSEKCFHDIKLTKTSLLHEIFQSDSLSVNSYHHQGVKKVAPGFRVTARSKDGFVEAIRAEGKRFVYGVQFHPEKMLEKEPRLRKIFKRFMKEVKAFKTRP